MSDIETHVGKAKELVFGSKLSLLDKVRVLNKRGYKIDESDLWDDDYLEDDRFIVCGDRLFEVLEDEELDDGCICQASRNEDGTVSFTLKFYNGGTCLEEEFNKAVGKLESREVKNENVS